jgi:hypothetical protein
LNAYAEEVVEGAHVLHGELVLELVGDGVEKCWRRGSQQDVEIQQQVGGVAAPLQYEE